ncbi:MAG: hypothetical protein Q8N26_11595 [Myxococcales bacterium]|nr:hypothetical protein [Myxococcales bacterium]
MRQWGVPFETRPPGLFIVTYRAAAELAPDEQKPLIDAIEERLKSGPVALVFDVGPAVTMVDLSVPTFWLGVTTRLPLAAMSIVTASSAVRIAARGFKLAQEIRKHPMVVETHPTVDEAISWAVGRLST